jgi:hypothetical protein
VTDSSPAAVPAYTPEQASTAVVVWAYVLAVLLPIVGFIVGLVLMFKRRMGHGMAVLTVSVIAATVATAVVLDNATDDPAPSIEQQLNQADPDRIEQALDEIQGVTPEPTLAPGQCDTSRGVCEP